mmetsp:Transcript_20962/g.34643  ORF Transcript_20962/g.34643 Transcript_20962/m.34643 type:complete len:436 (-) Transcript_20962:77-1384(-)
MEHYSHSPPTARSSPAYIEGSEDTLTTAATEGMQSSDDDAEFIGGEKKKKTKKKRKQQSRLSSKNEYNDALSGILSKRDWRVDLFGPVVMLNQSSDNRDIESPSSMPLSTETLIPPGSYDYIAVLFVAKYCPDCKLFASQVMVSVLAFESQRCKVVVCSSDRNEKDYAGTCSKLRGFDILPYDPCRARRLRDILDVSTIPALIILENKNIESYQHPGVICNARNVLVNDPTLVGFPWDPKEARQSLSAWDRLIINGRYGKWYHMGHRNVNSSYPDEMYCDERSVRIRAGMLNGLSWGAFMAVFFVPESIYIQVIFPIVGYEFLASGIFGLVPLAPLGTIATLMSIVLHPDPVWKPAKPMRFAWAIGLFLATSCYLTYLFRDTLGPVYPYVLSSIIFMCNFFTWLESAAGFCFGCFVFNNIMVPLFGFKECHACKE